MTAIHLALTELAVPQDKALRALLEKLGIKNDAAIQFTRAPNGKPVLDVTSHSAIGFSRSYARIVGAEFTAVAVVQGCDIGIDIEAWSQKKAEDAFLETIASHEEKLALAHLAADGRDAGVALWVIKEAALKCTGEVMLDPLDLAVSLTKKGVFEVRSSRRAHAPHPDIDVRLFAVERAGILFLLGVALAYGTYRPSFHLQNIGTGATGILNPI